MNNRDQVHKPEAQAKQSGSLRLRFRLVWIGIASCIALALAACSRIEPGSGTPAEVERLADLPLTRGAVHRGLQGELALLEAAGGLPRHLTDEGPMNRNGVSTAANRRVHAAQIAEPSIAPDIVAAFPPISRSMIQAQLDRIYSSGPLATPPVELERARELLRKQAASCERFRHQIFKPSAAFRVPAAAGIFADLDFLESLEIACRLEAIAAAVDLAENRPSDAAPRVAVVLRAAHILAAEQNVTTRLAAARVRSMGLEMLAAAAGHPQATRTTYEQLLQIVRSETNAWPSDADVWIGERAAGLVLYELVRDGQYLSLLAPEEVKRLEDEHLVQLTARAVLRGIDEDEAFYLRSMRQLIEVSERPYCERLRVMESIRNELTVGEDRADYPLIAGRLLLADFETVQQAQAEDFARCQAWLIALSTALGSPETSAPDSVLTGQPYRIEQTPLAVRVCELPAGRVVCELPLAR